MDLEDVQLQIVVQISVAVEPDNVQIVKYFCELHVKFSTAGRVGVSNYSSLPKVFVQGK
jgi:hypothetical protein